MVVMVPNIRSKGVLFPVGAGRSVRRAHVIQKGPVRPAPATGGNSPGTGLGTNTYTNTTGAGRQTVHRTLSPWLHSCTLDYVNDAVITSAGGDPATIALPSLPIALPQKDKGTVS